MPAQLNAPIHNAGNTKNIVPITRFIMTSSDVFWIPFIFHWLCVSELYSASIIQLSIQRASSHQKVRKFSANITNVTVIAVLNSYAENSSIIGIMIYTAINISPCTIGKD